MAFWRWKLHWQILLGLVIGIGLGLATGYDAAAAKSELAGRWDWMLYDLVGDLFLNGLKLIVVPIVMSSLIVAVAGMGSHRDFARLGGKTLAYYLSTSLIAILVGLTLVNVIQPGVTDPANPVLKADEVPALKLRFAEETASLGKHTEGRQVGDFLDTIRDMVPPNVIQAAAEGQLLGLIVVSLLVGYFIHQLEDRKKHAAMNLAEAVYDITLLITDLVLRLAPLGVAALIARTLSTSYADLAQDNRLVDFATIIVKFFVTTLAALAIHTFIILPLLLLIFARVKPSRHFRAMTPALLTAFSTASSSATLPVTMDCVEKRAGVSNRIASFVLPLGATVNMDGTALYECTAAMFIAQAYGIQLSFTQQVFVVLVALLTSIGVAGVPAASLVAIVIILKGVGVPMEGLAIILVVDRLLDMCRTSVNIFSDSCGAVIVAVSEGETVLQA
ncbi:MAG: dicarboxylate/amino acid:cation symporter [Phycisphaeraceae bacterium]|nr:dicarboxylate/amino acid:cation symporter [Phycisphaeraceae bacterium]